MDKEQRIRQECWNKSLHALGTSYVFQLKASFYKRWIRVITILGLIVPLLLGATIAAYGQNSEILNFVLLVTAPISIFQIVLSGISLVLKWDDQLSYSLESITDNRIISEEYAELAKNPPNDVNELERHFVIVKIKDDARTRQDEKISFTSIENRKGMRYALWIMQKDCATCKVTPLSMTPSECETCGKF